MAARLERQPAAQGLIPLPPERALLALERALGLGAPQVAVMDADWALLAAQGGNAHGLKVDGLAAPAPARGPDLKAELRDAAPEERYGLLAGFIWGRLAAMLGLDAELPLQARRPLTEVGLDSLLAVELRNQLGRALGLTLSATLFFDYPTVDALVTYLLDTVLDLGVARPAVPAAAAPALSADSLLDRIAQLSDEEVEQLFSAQLQNEGPADE